MRLNQLIDLFCERNPEKYEAYPDYSGKLMFGKKCMDVMFNDGHYTIRGAMTVEAVEKLLKNKPYIVTIREEYCWDGEIAYGIKKL